ncbi:MAG: hypothetical protein LUG98_01265 [Tannerellaceae bacterium]|nr:hypothetical protein [Tannerellaceae bacterium]
MKHILNGFVGFLGFCLLFAACSPDSVDHPSEADLPKVSELQINITVGNKNVVTFRIENQGVIPIWIFSEDGEISQVVGNDYSKTYAEAGVYTVEVKVYNSNGISEGSVTKDFTVNEDLSLEDDPNAVIISGGSSKTWVWDMASPGHIGCGDSGTEGLNWWSAGPYEKADTGMTDDELTFTITGKYTFDPGPDGLIYVNEGSGYKPEYFTDNGDYDAPCDPMTVSYYFEEREDQLYLIFPKNTIVSYIPNVEALSNPEFRILTLTEDKLEFVVDNGGIAWHYQFIPK